MVTASRGRHSQHERASMHEIATELVGRKVSDRGVDAWVSVYVLVCSAQLRIPAKLQV